jgi:hypothetical protein
MEKKKKVYIDLDVHAFYEPFHNDNDNNIWWFKKKMYMYI